MASKKPHPSSKKAKSNLADYQIRLNKFLANAGICNRREADDLIKHGLVKVNGKVVTELGVKVLTNDKVEYDGKQVFTGEKVYVLLNKPKGFSCSTSDKDKKLAAHLVKRAFADRVYLLHPMDTIDKGLIVLTNDYYMAEQQTKVTNSFTSLYKVELDKPISELNINRIGNKENLENQKYRIHKIATADVSRKILGVELSNDNKSNLKLLFDELGYKVESLDRVMYGKLTKKNISRGQWRYLTESEILTLKRLTIPS